MTATTETELPTPTVESARAAWRFGECIGEGSFREVYRVIDDPWCYKFLMSDSYLDMQLKEPQRAEYLSKMCFQGIMVPKMVLLEGQGLRFPVVAAEYVRGTRPHSSYGRMCCCQTDGLSECWITTMDGIEIRTGLGDLINTDNVRIIKGQLWIIDLGGYS